MQYLRNRCILASAVLAVAVTTLVAGPANAGACSGGSGVTVVVQFPDGHTETGCAPGDPSNGIDALTGAGFAYTFVQGQPGAVCTIDQVPASNCWGAASYWAYFHGNSHGSWDYSNVGASGYDPKPGSWEGWRFGSGSAPTTRPSAATGTPTPRPSPAPTHRPTASVASPVVRGTAAPASAAPTAGPAASTPPASATPTVPAPRVTASPTATDSAAGTLTGTAKSAPVRASAARAAASGSGLSWVVGVILLLVLGTGGTWVSLRRRG